MFTRRELNAMMHKDERGYYRCEAALALPIPGTAAALEAVRQQGMEPVRQWLANVGEGLDQYAGAL